MTAAGTRMHYLRLLLVLLLFPLPWVFSQEPRTSTSGSAATGQESGRLDFFETRIRPILVQSCYECHNSIESAQGGLELDWRGGLLTGGDSGPAIVSGRPEDSRLLAVIKHQIPGVEMPEDRPALDERIIADFEQWIREGAVDPRDQQPTAEKMASESEWDQIVRYRQRWWSFQPLGTSLPPPSSHSSSSHHPMDDWILHRLQVEGIPPAPRASVDVLIRRAYFAIVGLPPTPEELLRWQRAFKNRGPEHQTLVFEQLIDSLLASPHFGERWGRHWMDWIRYSESHGSEGDPSIPNAWMYRDYVIRSFNADIPLDRMVREYIAGDLLADPRVDPVLEINESALGPVPWRMVFHGFSPTDALDERVRFLDDHINTMSKAFLGLTVSCARCHDHKFDPISQKDYYALYGIAASARPAQRVIDAPQRQKKNIPQLVALKEELRSLLSDHWANCGDVIRSRFLRWSSDKESAAVGDYWGIAPPSVKAPEFQQSPPGIIAWDFRNPQHYRDWTASGEGLPPSPQQHGDFHIASSDERILDAVFPSGVVSNSISRKHESRLTSPSIRLETESQLWLYAAGDGGALARYVVQDYPRSGTVYPVRNLTPDWQWIQMDLSYWTGDEIHIEIAHPLDTPLPQSGNTEAWFAVRHCLILPKGASPGGDAKLAAPFLMPTDTAPGEQLDTLVHRFEKAVIEACLAWGRGMASDEQLVMLQRALSAGILPNSSPENAKIQEMLLSYRKLEREIAVPRRVPGMEERDGGDQPLFVRGNHTMPQGAVRRRFLEVIDGTPYEPSGSGRSELARSLLDPGNPLTSRVLVNRIWHHLFGRGLVGTTDNFGHVGDQPSHPQLLDQLARELSMSGWSLKQLIRHIVTSDAWQRSSTPEPTARQRDPANQFLSHQSLRRLEAEPIRDLLLVAAGSLDRSFFGPPVAGNAGRRSIYIDVRRNSLHPFLAAFDFPEPFTCTGRRNATNVPAQSLMLMNDPDVVQLSMQWVHNRIAAQPHATDREISSELFFSLVGRYPSDSEKQLLEESMQQLDDAFQIAHQQRENAQRALVQAQEELRLLLEPVRTRLLSEGKSLRGPTASSPPEPREAWNFFLADSDSIRESIDLEGSAEWTEEGLKTGAAGFGRVVSSATVQAKTLEAWVVLDNLQQQGGGLLSIQSENGELFDSLVFAELDPGRWLAGSEYHARTKPFRGQEEVEGDEVPVHFAVTYALDGSVVAYRNGEPYGEPYRSAAPREYPAGTSVLTFGLRHLPPGGNRYLQGTVLAARLYDRALEPAEVLASFVHGPHSVSTRDVVDALSPAERTIWAALQDRLEQCRKELREIPPSVDLGQREARVSQIARAMLTLQEAIFLQ